MQNTDPRLWLSPAFKGITAESGLLLFVLCCCWSENCEDLWIKTASQKLHGTIEMRVCRASNHKPRTTPVRATGKMYIECSGA